MNNLSETEFSDSALAIISIVNQQQYQPLSQRQYSFPLVSGQKSFIFGIKSCNELRIPKNIVLSVNLPCGV
ncbi:hypothetical protein ACNQF7_11275 [Flavobacterium sp. RSP29]|uniref:hypothetical protein n=1 Tax=Flavobacterium sp. RSP29 TaxID=3401731 RepID=UPI003AAA3CEC